MRRRWIRWLTGLAVLAGTLAFGWSRAKDENALRQRRHRLGTLALACKFYAGDHGGAMPPDLGAVFPKYLNDPTYRVYAADDVAYFPGATDADPPNTMTMRERRPDPRGRRWVEHLDCAIELVQPSRLPSPTP